MDAENPKVTAETTSKNTIDEEVLVADGQALERQLNSFLQELLLLLLRVREAFCPRRRPHSGPIERARCTWLIGYRCLTQYFRL